MTRTLSVVCWFVIGCAAANGEPTVDASIECAAGEIRPCYPGPETEVGVGVCRAGTQRCENGAFGACIDAVTAAARETCGDNLDNDCNNDLDNDCPCSYQKSTGPTGNGTKLCCNDSDTLLAIADCGNGSNHTVQQSGECGVAIEGSNNGGSPCVRITCTGSLAAGVCQ